MAEMEVDISTMHKHNYYIVKDRKVLSKSLWECTRYIHLDVGIL